MWHRILKGGGGASKYVLKSLFTRKTTTFYSNDFAEKQMSKSITIFRTIQHSTTQYLI